MSVVRSSFVIASCIGFLAGIAVASFAYVASYVPPWTFVVLVVGLLTAAVWRFGHHHRVVVCCGVVAMGLGVLRFTAIADASRLAAGAFPGDVTLEGSVRSVAPLTQGRSRIRLVGAQIATARRGDAGATATFRRPIDIFLPSPHDRVVYGDTIRVRCRYAPPVRLGDRLTIDGTCGVRDVGDLQVLATDGGSPTMRVLGALRRGASQRFASSLPEPGNGIVQSMVLGVPHAVGLDLEAAFRRSGTIHILVVSGWHMSFLALCIRNAFLRIGIHRRTSAKLAMVIIAAYAAMVGLTAPAVRGALVAIALLAVYLLGRVANPLRILLLVATAMVAVHPHILGFDLAFQLTVAATAAILLIAPIADRVLPCRPGILREVRDLLGASIAASFATAPLLASAFGVVALLGPLIGVVVLPLAAAIIPIGAALLAASVVLPFVVPPITWALAALTGAIAHAVERTAALPWAQFPAPRLDGWFIAGLYLLILAAVLRWYRHREVPILSPFAFSRREDR